MQKSQPEVFVVTIVETPARELTVADVIVGSLGVAGVLLVIALALGAVFSLVLLGWRRRFPLDHDHLPPISPLVPDPTARPTSQAR